MQYTEPKLTEPEGFQMNADRRADERRVRAMQPPHAAIHLTTQQPAATHHNAATNAAPPRMPECVFEEHRIARNNVDTAVL